MKRKCLIIGCNHEVYAQNEVDVTVGIITSNEPPICEDCATSENEYIKKQVDEILNKDKNEMPFLI